MGLNTHGAGIIVRIGIMERDALEAHGCPWFVKDRLMEQSDETRVWLCRICGLPALVTNEEGSSTAIAKKECTVCESKDIALVRMPYATKLLMQQFAGMNVIIRVLTTPGTNIGTIYKGNRKIGECVVEKV